MDNQAFALDGLNSPQRRAVLHNEGPLLVLAGAGSGKTRVIIYRIARLLHAGVPPEAILGVTFTNKAAQEMSERLSKLAGRKARKVTLSTFHALGLTILKQDFVAAGLRKGFCIYNTADQLSLVRDLMRQVKVADRRLDANRILDVLLKTKRLRLDEVEIDWGDDYELAAYELYPRYVAQMRAYNAIDFDDLILRCQDALVVPEVRQRWASRYAYLLVDEYQDTSPDQLDLLRVLAGEKQNICAVGDDDQAIYGWRGAAADNIISFTKHFRSAVEIVLDQNYRSTGNILAAANSVICNNTQRKEKVLWSGGGDGDPVEIVECADDEDEAAFIVEIVLQLRAKEFAYSDLAVLYRSNVQSRLIEEMLSTERIPYRVVGGQAFFDRKEVRDAMAFLAVAHNPSDEVALRRIVNVPPRGIGATSLERLVEHGERTGNGLWAALQEAHGVADLPKAAASGACELCRILTPASTRLQAARPGELVAAVRQLFGDLGLKDAVLAADDSPSVASRRLENLEEVQNALGRFENRMEDKKGAPLAEFLRASSLVRATEENAPGNNVTLMTLHSAKGLEFPFVVMAGLEEDLLPHRRTLDLGGDLGEERRLCYVGMTRARQRLWMAWSRHRIRNGKYVPRTPSRFLQELPSEGAVLRRTRGASTSPEQVEASASDFFKTMRAQLGIE